MPIPPYPTLFQKCKSYLQNGKLSHQPEVCHPQKVDTQKHLGRAWREKDPPWTVLFIKIETEQNTTELLRNFKPL